MKFLENKIHQTNWFCDTKLDQIGADTFSELFLLKSYLGFQFYFNGQ